MIGLFIIGVIFRIWFSQLVPQPFVYDQEEYYGYALGILKNGLHADIYRLYGYPMIIAPLIALFDVASPFPWTVFHAILDSITAFLIYWMAKKVFTSEKPAWVGFILYLFNPFTAGYVGVLLSEVVATFLVALILLLTIFYREKKSVLLLCLLSFLLGFLPQVRPAFVYFSFFVLMILVIHIRKKLKWGIIFLFLYAVPYSYNIVGNFLHYGELAPLSVDRVFARELYASLFIERGLAFTDTQYGAWPKEALQVWGELARPKNAKERDLVAKKYIDLSIEKIKSDPWRFVRSRIAKMGYVWEKHFVFPYAQGKPTSMIKAAIYWGNMGLLGIGLIGLIGWIRRIRWFTALTVFLVVYISVAHIFSTSEERFSLPAYPLVILFAGYGIWRLRHYFRLRRLS